MALLCTFAALSYTWAQCDDFSILANGTTAGGTSPNYTATTMYGETLELSVSHDDGTFKWLISSTVIKDGTSYSPTIEKNPASNIVEAYRVVCTKNGFDTEKGITLTIQPRPSYTVTFNSDGGTPTPAVQTVLKDSLAKEPTETVTKTGYTFEGWKNPSNAIINFDEFPITGNITLTAEWTANKYTITFQDNTCGNSNTTKEVTFNEKVGALTTPTCESHDFNGWFTAETGGTEYTDDTDYDTPDDITLYAQWDIKKYDVVFNSNGGTSVSTQTIDHGSVASEPTPTKTGYTLAHWYLTDENTAYNFSTPVTATITLNAKWTLIEYTITYEEEGGTGTCSPTSYTIETANITLPTTCLTKEGASFGGWFENKSEFGDDSKKTSTIPNGSTGDKTFYAYWITNTYTVKFNSNGGDAVADITDVPHGTTISKPTDPTRSDYTFGEWYKDDGTFSTPFDFDNDEIKSNITLYAKWNPTPYNITYELDGGTCTECSTITTYNVTELPKNLPAASGMSKTGYTFDGWFDNSGFSGTAVTQIPSGSTGDKKYYAKWDLITYNINYELNSGTCVSACNAATYNIESSDITLPTDLDITREGYTFEGWYENSDLTTGGVVTTIATGSYGHKTFYAKWEIEKYTVTFNIDGGNVSSPAPIETPYNTTITKPANPTKEGYTLSEWYSDSGFSTEFNFSTPIKSHTTLYAKWIANEYKITFNVNFPTGGVGSTPATPSNIDVEYDKAVGTLPTLSNITSHEFGGWKDEDGNIYTNATVYKETRNITLYAQWTPNPYTISFDVNFPSGGEGTVSAPSDITVTFNEPVSSLTTLSDITSHKFTGWFTAASGGTQYTTATIYTETTDITLYAQWEIKTYTVSFNSNSGSAVEDIKNVPHGSTISKPTDPSREGYTFEGWYNEPGLSTEFTFDSDLITDNKTLYAKWEIITYYITYDFSDGDACADCSNTAYTEYTINDLPFNTFPTPTKANHTFEGWYNSADSKVTTITAVDPTTIALKAKFEINKYTVAFNIDGANVALPAPITGVAHGNTISKPTDPSREGYILNESKWYNESGFSTEFTFDSDPITDNKILYAKWLPKTYTVTFTPNCPTPTVESCPTPSPTSISVTYDAAIASSLPDFKDKLTGYEFEGWFTAATGGTKYEEGDAWKTDGASTITLYAQWTPNPWKIYFKTNYPDGTDYNHAVQNVVYNGPVGDLPSNPPPFPGYEFKGWFDKPTLGEGTQYTKPATYTKDGDSTLHAQWEFIPGPPSADMIDFTITPNGPITYNGNPIDNADIIRIDGIKKPAYPGTLGTITAYSYKSNGNTITGNPKDAGTYQICVNIAASLPEYSAVNDLCLGTFEIAKVPVTVNITSATAENKTYDAKTNAEVTNVVFEFIPNLFPNDQISANDYSVIANFAQPDAGTNIPVNITVNILSNGPLSKNYNITLGTATFATTADIEKATGILKINPPPNYELASNPKPLPTITDINPFVDKNTVTWQYKRDGDDYLPQGMLPNRVGDWTVRASFPEGQNYTGAEATATFSVTRGNNGAVEHGLNFANEGFTLDPELSTANKKYYVAGTKLCNIKETKFTITLEELDIVLKQGIIPGTPTLNENGLLQYEISHTFGKPGLDTIYYNLSSSYERDPFSEKDTILIETPIPFKTVTAQKWNNTLLVNNNYATNGGYEFTDFKWFKNGDPEPISLMQYYSAGPNSTDLLNPEDTYKATMITSDGIRISTCEDNPATTTISNATIQKASKQVLGINGTTNQNPNAKIYNSKGERINIPKPGVYIVTE